MKVVAIEDSSITPESHVKGDQAATNQNQTTTIFQALEKHRQVELTWFDKIVAFHLHPQGKFHAVWDIIICVLLLISTIWQPVKVAFYPSMDDMEFWEILIDVAFYVDILVTFHTGFNRGFEVITDKKEIAKNYAKGWLLLDVIATVEIDLLITALDEQFAESNTALVKVSRLLKFTRLARMGRLINRRTANLTIHTGYIEFFKFIAYVFLCAHFLACMFFLLPQMTQGCKFDKKFAADEKEWCFYNSWVQENELYYPVGPGEQYINSLYWAITTMTTIGYGDIGPQNQSEIIFVICAEVIGLPMFALLLTQINNLNDVMGMSQARHKSVKNEILVFMKENKLDATLLDQVIEFLNFKFHSHSGRFFCDDDHRFEELSGPLRQSIRQALFIPVLKKVRMFGHNKEDLDEEHSLVRIFNELDVDKGGSLDEHEICDLMRKMGINMEQAQLKVAILEMTQDVNLEVVNVKQFKDWWFLKRVGTLPLPQSPLDLLNCLVENMSVEPFSPKDVVVKAGDYGKQFQLILTGAVVINKKAKDDSSYLVKKVNNEDWEPILGLCACLPDYEYKKVCRATVAWEVTATRFVDIATLSRDMIRAIIQQKWPESAERLPVVAKYSYNPILGDPQPSIGDGDMKLSDEGIRTIDRHLVDIQPTPRDTNTSRTDASFSYAGGEGAVTSRTLDKLVTDIESAIDARQKPLLDHLSKLEQAMSSLDASGAVSPRAR